MRTSAIRSRMRPMREPSPPTPLPHKASKDARLSTGFAGEGSRDPMRAAQANMRPQPVKRFYKEAEVAEEGGRFVLSLDGRRARTPGRNPISAASRDLMRKVAG